MDIHQSQIDENTTHIGRRETQKLHSSSRTPLSFLDANRLFKSTTEIKKKESLSFLLDTEIKKRISNVLVTKDHKTVEKIEKVQNDGEPMNAEKSIELTDEIFRDENEETSDFWSEEMESLLTLRIANPIYDSDSDPDSDEECENIETNKLNQQIQLKYEDLLQDRLDSVFSM